MSGVATVLRRLGRAGRLLEDALLVSILCALVVFAGGQIIFRNFFELGVIWGDELTRLMVAWVAIAGGIAAAREDKHLSIAILDQFLSPAGKLRVGLISNLFTAAICGLLTWYGIRFVLDSLQFGDTVLVRLPAWPFQLIVPLGFALICLHYLGHAGRKAFLVIRGGEA